METWALLLSRCVGKRPLEAMASLERLLCAYCQQTCRDMMGMGLYIYHPNVGTHGSRGSAWRTRDALLGEEPVSQAAIPPILRMWCLEPTPHLSLDINGLCFGARLSTAGWTWNLIYLVVSLYV